MLDALREKLFPESPEPVPSAVTCGITGGIHTYRISLREECNNPSEVAEIVDAVIRMMKEKKVSLQTAMYLPEALHDELEKSFYIQVFTSILAPLPNDGDDQRDDGNGQGQN